MSVVKSEILKKLSKNYPNFLQKDLSKLIDIIIYELKNAPKRGKRVELRDIFSIEPRVQKERSVLKISKNWSKKINEKI